MAKNFLLLASIVGNLVTSHTISQVPWGEPWKCTKCEPIANIECKTSVKKSVRLRSNPCNCHINESDRNKC